MNGGEGIEEGWRRAGRWDETASTTMEIRVLHATGRGETRNTRARARAYTRLTLTGLDHEGGRVVEGGGKGKPGMIARSDYVFTRNGGRNGRENSLGSAVPRTAVRLFELCMDTGCLQRVLFALPRSTTILEASPRARMTWKHTTARPTAAVSNSNLNSATLARHISRESRLSPAMSAYVLRVNFKQQRF